MPPRAFDKQEASLALLLTPALLAEALKRVCEELGDVVQAVFASHGVRHPIREARACDALADAIDRVEARVASWAQSRGSFEWLFMLRRMQERVFEGDLATSLGYDSTLADVLSAASGLSRAPIVVPLPDGSLYYDVDRKAANHLARFCQGVRYASDLHVAYRWAAKGATIVRCRDGLVRAEPSKSIRTAARLYDERVDAAGGRLRGATVTFDLDRSTASTTILGLSRIQPTWLPVDLPSGRCEVHVRFVGRAVSIDDLRRFAPDLPAVGWPAEVELLLLASRIASIYLVRHRAGIATLVQRGYLVATTEFFERIADDVLADGQGFLAEFPAAQGVRNGVDLLARLSELRASTWPLLAGPILREAGSQICFDVAALWARLRVRLQYPPATGALANMRAEHFELRVQDAVSASKWRPSEALASLRGRKLKRNRLTITDIDAIGELDGTLLFVSCKSIVLTGEHDRGTHNDIRNAAGAVSGYVADWRTKVAALRAAPGDNFDFAAHTRVIGVVCTPHVVYVESGDATAEVDNGLRACSSFAEFIAWLNQ